MIDVQDSILEVLRSILISNAVNVSPEQRIKIECKVIQEIVNPLLKTIRKSNLLVKQLRKEKKKWYSKTLELSAKLGRHGLTA